MENAAKKKIETVRDVLNGNGTFSAEKLKELSASPEEFDRVQANVEQDLDKLVSKNNALKDLLRANPEFKKFVE